MSTNQAWFEDFVFWEVTEPFIFPPDRWETAASSIENICSLLQVTPPASILDLCCGPGRFSLPLAAAGYRVTAVDRTIPYLDKLRSKSSASSLDIEIVPSDMRDFCRPGAFDVALNLSTSFGYFDDPADDLKVLRNLRVSLKPGGRFLLEIANREWIINTYQKRDWVEHNGALMLEERQLVDSFSRLRNRWIVIRGSERRDFEFEVRLYGAAELAALVRHVGFTEIAMYGSFEGGPCDLKSPRLVILATK